MAIRTDSSAAFSQIVSSSTGQFPIVFDPMQLITEVRMNVHDRNMRKEQWKQWQEWVALLAGLWLAASPWLLGHADHPTLALYNALTVGILIALISAANLIKEERWEPIASVILGLWAVASPWIFHFWAARSLGISTAIAGGVVAVVSLLQVAEHHNPGNRLPQ
jgi:uncharacterized membrane protein HdeD (DUF308 family)